MYSFPPALYRTDVTYPVHALLAAREIKAWLDGERRRDIDQVMRFRRILADMAAGQRFEGGVRDSRDMPAPVSADEALKYRLPVWQLIASHIESLPGDEDDSLAGKAAWLLQQVKECEIYAYYRSARDAFQKEVERHHLSFRTHPHTDGFMDEDVIVLGAFEERGSEAMEEVKQLVADLIAALEDYLRSRA